MNLTYDKLLTQVPAEVYAENRQLVAAMPEIIARTEERLLHLVDHDLFRTVLPIKAAMSRSLIDMNGYKPAILEVRGFRVATRVHANGEPYSWVPLERRDIEAMTMLYPTDRPGIPRYYAEDEAPLHYRLFPMPRIDMQLRVSVNQEPTPLGPMNPTNVFLDQFPLMFFASCCYQASVYMRDEALMTRWEKEAIGTLTQANEQLRMRRRDDTDVQPRDPHNKVAAG